MWIYDLVVDDSILEMLFEYFRRFCGMISLKVNFADSENTQRTCVREYINIFVCVKNKLHDTKGIQMSHVTVAYA